MQQLKQTSKTWLSDENGYIACVHNKLRFISGVNAIFYTSIVVLVGVEFWLCDIQQSGNYGT